MSLFCGIYSPDRRRQVPAPWRTWLRANLSRSAFGTVHERDDAGLYLAYLDLGTFEGAGWRHEEQYGLVAMAGDPLLAGRRPADSRETDLAKLHAADMDDYPGILRQARGNHCIAAYRARDHRLVLATDRLGFRPLFWLEHDGFLLFAGARRLLEDVPGIPLTVDFRGAIETACFGFALADRTEYSRVRSLRGGSMLRPTVEGARVTPYWNWATDACVATEADEGKLIQDVFEAFREGIRLRLGDSRNVYAGLSGGLDTRCVVAALRTLGADVTSINVSWAGSLDESLGRDFANAIGSRHLEQLLPLDKSGREVPKLSWEMMKSDSELRGLAGPATRQLWGGNDGSICVGYVYVDEPAVAALRRGSLESAAAHFLSGISVISSPLPYRRRFAAAASEVPLRGVTEELQRSGCADPAQALFVFLLENHQRRMLSWHYEEIDLLPFEHVEPFFDADLLSATCRIPVDFGMRHRFYHRWLAAFPPAVAAVPWQSYPGHEECPLPLPPESMHQWGGVTAGANQRLSQRRVRRETIDLLWRWRGAGRIMSRPKVFAAWLAGSSRVRDTEYILKQANRLGSVLERCDGRVMLENADAV